MNVVHFAVDASASNCDEPTASREDGTSPAVERPVVEPVESVIEGELTSTHGAVDANSLNMSLEVSFNVPEDSEASCLLEAADVQEESKLSVDAGLLSSDCVSSVDCDSTANSVDDVSLSSSDDCDGLVTTNNDATLLASDALPMDTV